MIAALPKGPNLENLAGFPFAADTLLPSESTSGVTRFDSVVILRADEIPAAESAEEIGYTAYDIVGTVDASYEVGGVPVSVVVAKFVSANHAFGWYSVHRPNLVEIDTIGVESFRMGSVRHVIKGDYVITLDAGGDSGEAVAAMDRLARLIADKITVVPGVTRFHVLFPSHDRVRASERYYAYNYLGIVGFNDVYTMDYAVGIDTSTMILSPDSSGVKFLVLEAFARSEGEALKLPDGVRFDQGLGIYIDHPRHGRIIGGLVVQKIVGVVGYDPERSARMFARWVKGLRM